ncbi:DUF4214 domain-containing protein [Oerskovia sp. NPDC060287]|uniref:DUF4214 domain-containing protein n=1 Tax=Oerskovia sp. NPDC060287 TaxID=3347095 RepID=UPI00364A2B34
MSARKLLGAVLAVTVLTSGCAVSTSPTVTDGVVGGASTSTGALFAAAALPDPPSPSETVVEDFDVVVDLASARSAAPTDPETGATSEPGPSATSEEADPSTGPETGGPSTGPEAPSSVPEQPLAPEESGTDGDDGTVVVDQPDVEERTASGVVTTDGFQTVAVSWTGEPGSDAPALQVRTRAGEEWSDWSDLETSDDGPDAGTADALQEQRSGTDALWVGEADAVQLGVVGQDALPADLRLSLISSPESGDETGAADASGASSTQKAVIEDAAYRGTAPRTVLAAAPAVNVITRAQWGARAEACTPDVAQRLVAAVVHHTAGSNNYSTAAQAMQMIRNDQAYHIGTRGWCDLGYNFVVDKWGNIYEGRAGSLERPVIGVHAGGFNTSTVGISMLGDYSTVTPSAATVDAVSRLASIRLAAYGINPQGSVSYTTGGGENSRYPAGSTAVLPTIFAHRDTAFTACPGQAGYNQMGTIRAIASSYSYGSAYKEAQSVVNALYQDFLGRGVDPTGLATWSTALASGTSQSQLVASLTSSDEYVWKRINQAYVEVLGRQPDPASNDWYVGVRRGTVTVDDVARRFYSSQEFYNRSGATDAGLVSTLYSVMLGRSAGPSEIAFWESRIPTAGRAALVDAIWFSYEAAARRAGTYYQTFLQRSPDPTGLATWTDALLRFGEGSVRVGIAGSVEYRNKALVRFP